MRPLPHPPPSCPILQCVVVSLQSFREKRLRDSSVQIQAAARGMLARRIAQNIRRERIEHRAALVIQSSTRALLARKEVDSLRLERQESLKVRCGAWPRGRGHCCCAGAAVRC